MGEDGRNPRTWMDEVDLAAQALELAVHGRIGVAESWVAENWVSIETGSGGEQGGAALECLQVVSTDLGFGVTWWDGSGCRSLKSSKKRQSRHRWLTLRRKLLGLPIKNKGYQLFACCSLRPLKRLGTSDPGTNRA